VGPYFREVLLFAPLSVFVIDLVYTRRPNALKGISLLGVLHGLFPSVLRSIVFLQRPDFSCSLGQVTVSDSLKASLAASLNDSFRQNQKPVTYSARRKSGKFVGRLCFYGPTIFFTGHLALLATWLSSYSG